jgi:hypothetical protein
MTGQATERPLVGAVVVRGRVLGWNAGYGLQRMIGEVTCVAELGCSAGPAGEEWRS